MFGVKSIRDLKYFQPVWDKLASKDFVISVYVVAKEAITECPRKTQVVFNPRMAKRVETFECFDKFLYNASQRSPDNYVTNNI